MKPYSYDGFGNLLPHAGASDQERKAGGIPKVLATGAALLQSGGVYDGAVAAYYVGAVRPKHTAGLFTSADNHAGVVSDPARLARFGYASESPVETADPAQGFLSCEIREAARW